MKKNLFFLAILLLAGRCATYQPQNRSITKESFPQDKEIQHSFYLIGDAGNANLHEVPSTLEAFKKELDHASSNATAIFLGDNVYRYGIPKKSAEDYELANYRLKVQTDVTKDFKGNTIFLPGNHDWFSGLDGLKRQEHLVEKYLGKNTFLPENGCSILRKHITKEIDLIIIDSQWYITNWNKHPQVNDDCDIKTREGFLNEFSSLIKKARGKTTIVALHHPMYSNGPHGGEYSLMSSLKPLPLLGTLKNVIRKTSGGNKADIQHIRYRELKKRLVAMAQANKKVIFISGHEHSLQYLVEDNLHQIISGSGSLISPVRMIGGGRFGFATNGFVRLDIFNDGSSYVRFYSVNEDEIVFERQVFPPDVREPLDEYPSEFPPSVSASIYTDEEANKTGFKKWLWGERYRKYYSTKVNVPTVHLDTLYGGLKPIRKGGGNQSKSLRLEDKEGAQYVMRALRKQALQYLQAVLFKDQYIEGQFDDTVAESLLLDVFTGSHPYAPFVIGDLSDAVGVFHTNPILYYVPKQNALGSFNQEFGDELYMIEEHASEGHADKASFGFQDKLFSTPDMLEKLHQDEDIMVDEASYIRARLFDMLIGDWDRHQDQWRWIQFNEGGKKIMRPMPRDRDQAFSIMSDGFLLGVAVKLVPLSRLLRKYSDDLVDVKGVNASPYPLDMELIVQSDKEIWDQQVKIIQKGITDQMIDQAFLNMPAEVRDETVEEIKRKLKARRGNLQKISDRYFTFLNKLAVIKGTNKDDWFDVQRWPNGLTKITAFRIQKGEKGEIFHERVYSHEQTKEIWIYGLDDDDVFHVFGENGTNEIRLRLVGGQNRDTYDIKNGKRVSYYDYKSKKSDVMTKKGKQKFRDDYQTNVYNFKKLKPSGTQIIPSLGSNPDDGFKIGWNLSHTHFGFERNPFTVQHHVNIGYYFATEGYDMSYASEFAHIFKGVNFGIEGLLTSPNYAINFFGFGNGTDNLEEEKSLDFNRVRVKTLKIMPSLVWRGELGGSFKVGMFYQSHEIERDKGRFLDITSNDEGVFEKQEFMGGEIRYHFENKDNHAFPTLGFQISVDAGLSYNVNSPMGYGYVVPEVGFNYRLVPSGQLVLATNLRSHFNIGDEFQFYQGATIGAKNGLRGFRNERFTGKTSFVQSTDLRWVFNNMKTGLLPIRMGFFGGIDYGRVWMDCDRTTLDCHETNQWKNSLGGGFFINTAEMFAGNISVFHSDEGVRMSFGVGFDF
ncbi:MAG: metallophosphoesterase [Flavobacteriaceae bacterium]|nr:metallophosphoesterase [Flavobacteriaceae bacterium]